LIQAEIIDGPIPPLVDRQNDDDVGAELIFYGRVRGQEKKSTITALEYEYYPVMAEKKLTEIARQTEQKFNIRGISCIHRVGVVPVGESSVRIVIRSKHRKESLAAMDWFIVQLKKEVPIWKWGITADGSRFPSDAI